MIGGLRQRIHFFCLDLPQSDACFVKAYPRETTEAFLDGHVSSFAFFGGIPLSILYDNLKIAVAKICGDGKRGRTQAFTELVSHCLLQDRFGRPGKGNDKGKVEGLVKFSRANFMTPVPIAVSFEAFNAMLAERCRLRQDERACRHTQTPAYACWRIWRRYVLSRLWRWSPARNVSDAYRRRHWFAIGTTIIQFRPGMVSRKF